jgi:hypothetical protein
MRPVYILSLCVRDSQPYHLRPSFSTQLPWNAESLGGKAYGQELGRIMKWLYKTCNFRVWSMLLYSALSSQWIKFSVARLCWGTKLGSFFNPGADLGYLLVGNHRTNPEYVEYQLMGKGNSSPNKYSSISITRIRTLSISLKSPSY